MVAESDDASLLIGQEASGWEGMDYGTARGLSLNNIGIWLKIEG